MRALVLVLVACGIASAQSDYRLDSPAWNGLSRLVDGAASEGCTLVADDHLDWSRLGDKDVLFFVYPQSPLDPAAVGSFLERGGRMLVADDFGAAGPALEALQLHRSPARLEGVPREPGHPELPVARASLLTTLGRSTPRLVANHPAALETALPATFALSPGQALVVEGRVGKGRFVALADPSVLINNMLELDENRAFAHALVGELCESGRRARVFAGAFRVTAPSPSIAAGITTLPKLNDLLVTINRSAEDFLEGDLALPGAIALCVAAIALAWTALLRPRVARHADGRFIRADGVYQRSAHAVLDAMPRGRRADHRIALLVLRGEVLRRLGHVVGPIPAGGDHGELARRVAERLGREIGEAAERFFSTGPSFEAPGASHVSRAVFVRALALARPILSRTQEPDAFAR